MCAEAPQRVSALLFRVVQLGAQLGSLLADLADLFLVVVEDRNNVKAAVLKALIICERMANVASANPFSPVQASNIPLETIPINLTGFKLATTITCLPIKSSGA